MQDVQVRNVPLINMLYASTLFVTLCNSILALALPWLVLQSTGSIVWTGSIASVALGAVFVGSLASRILIESVGGKPVLLVGFCANVIGLTGLVYCFAQETLPISLLLFFVVVARLLDAATNIAIDARFPEIARYCNISLSKLNGVKESIIGGGAILGAAMAGWLLAVTDPLYVLGIAGFLGLLALVSFLPLLSFYRMGAKSPASEPMWKMAGWLWSQPHFRGFLILILVVSANVASMDDVLLPAFIDSTSKNPADIGWIFASYSTAAILAAVAYANNHNSISQGLILKAGIIGVALFFLALAVFKTPIAIIIAAFISGILTGALAPLIDTRLLNDTPRNQRISMLATVSTLAIGVAPVMVMIHTWVIDTFSLEVLCVGVAVILLMLLLVKKWE